MTLVVKNKDTGEKVMPVEQWLDTVGNPDWVKVWSTRDGEPTPEFDTVWHAYLQAVNGNVVEDGNVVEE